MNASPIAPLPAIICPQEPFTWVWVTVWDDGIDLFEAFRPIPVCLN